MERARSNDGGRKRERERLGKYQNKIQMFELVISMFYNRKFYLLYFCGFYRYAITSILYSKRLILATTTHSHTKFKESRKSTAVHDKKKCFQNIEMCRVFFRNGFNSITLSKRLCIYVCMC